MDAPEVAKRTGALLLGSESTANIGRGWGLPETQIRVVTDREPIQLGRFTVTPIESRHFQFPDPAMAERALGDPEIEVPLTPPVSAFDYKVGKAYVLHVAHPKGTWLIVGNTLTFLQTKAAANPTIELTTLPRYARVVLF